MTAPALDLPAILAGTAAPTHVPRPERRAMLRRVVRELERRRTPADLHPKQRVAFQSQANEILYGGAANGGKSHLMRRAAVTWCQWVPGLQVYLFRREFPDLFKNHMVGPSSFPVLLAEACARGEAKIIWGKNQIRFANGSMIHLCHCQHETDVFGYQGAEIHVLMIDELTQWTDGMYRYLRGRVRLGGLTLPRWLAHRFPRILCGANPGGVGHNMVKAAFIDGAPPLSVRKMPRPEGGMRRQFIPARMADNLTLDDAARDEYAGQLEGLGDPALVRAMLDGDWDIVSGGMFDDLWRRDVHVLAPFPIPRSWYLDRSFDWGSSKPFAVQWWAESDGAPATLADGTTRHFPRGTLVLVAQWYGCQPGKPNEGLKMLAVDIAKGIRAQEARWRTERGWRVNDGPADSSIFDVENGMCLAEDMRKAGVAWERADKSPGSRKTGWEKLRERLKAARDAPKEDPGLYVFDTCTDFIRAVPVLPRDERNSDDVDTKAEDHDGDAARYRLLHARRVWRTSHFAL